MDTIIGAMNNLVSLSDFNKGEAGKIFDAIKKNNQTKIVLKHNKPECVITSTENYIEMIQELEDLRDYKLAMERILKQSDTVLHEDVMKKHNITQADLDDMEEIEFD